MRKCMDLSLEILILNLNFNKEVNKGNDQNLKFNLGEQQLSIALLTDIMNLRE